MFGKGINNNIIEAYEWLIDNYNLGDEIFIFGFSRGAYTARNLAGLISLCGLLKAGAALSVKQIYERYKSGLSSKTIYKIIELTEAGRANELSAEEKWMYKYCHAAKIKAVAVWDTVGFVGLPIGSIEGISQSTFKYLHTGLRIPIENGYHALAIDEHRRAFLPTLWTAKKPNARSIESVEQRWFVGAHANVGGGCQNDLLPQPSLYWIMKKVSQHGLTFRTDVEIDGDIHTAKISDSYGEFMRGAYRYVSKKHDRKIDPDPLSPEGAAEYVVNETIDRTVFERWSMKSDYRPPSLQNWADKHSIEISTITSSVRADSPQTPVEG